MKNLLDERIGQHQKMEWACGRGVVQTSFFGVQYQGIANTIVQLLRRNAAGLIGR